MDYQGRSVVAHDLRQPVQGHFRLGADHSVYAVELCLVVVLLDDLGMAGSPSTSSWCQRTGFPGRRVVIVVRPGSGTRRTPRLPETPDQVGARVLGQDRPGAVRFDMAVREAEGREPAVIARRKVAGIHRL
jgi:hypothetical protein